jgi:hypothetical protein
MPKLHLNSTDVSDVAAKTTASPMLQYSPAPATLPHILEPVSASQSLFFEWVKKYHGNATTVHRHGFHNRFLERWT